MICCTATVSLTSCLGNDNDSGISPEEYKTWLSNISGFYMGGSTWQKQNKIYFYNDTITDKNNPTKTDSITGISATFFKGDSTVVVQGITNRVLAKEIKDNDDLKKALEDGFPQTQTMKAKFVFHYISSPQANYFVFPYDVTYPTLKFPNGETHEVTFKFHSPSLGVFQSLSTEQANLLQFYLKGVYVDGKLVQTIYDNSDDEEKLKRALLQVYVSR